MYRPTNKSISYPQPRNDTSDVIDWSMHNSFSRYKWIPRSVIEGDLLHFLRVLDLQNGELTGAKLMPGISPSQELIWGAY